MMRHLTELARQGQLLLLGDQRGRTHLVQVVGNGLEPGLLPEPIDVPSVRAVRSGLSDLTTLTWRRIQHPAGLRVTVAFAEGTWFRVNPRTPSPALIVLDDERARRRAA